MTAPARADRVAGPSPHRRDEIRRWLARARGYPYPAPAQSFLYRDGTAQPLDGARFAGRWPVLAHGSNRAPEQLARKFRHFSGAASEIPVTYVWLAGYDVVYSAHVTAYGAVASTLTRAPGCRVRVALSWLDDAQLARMHETEGNYAFGRLAGTELAPEAGPSAARTAIYMYLSDHGCLLDDAGRPAALAAVRAEARPHGALDQDGALALLRDRLAPDRPLAAFILQQIDDPETRAARIRAVKAHARPTEVPHFTPVG
jgi:hypothetical protein